MLKVTSKKYGCTIFCEGTRVDDLSILLLPSFFSHSLETTGSVYTVERRRSKGSSKFIKAEMIEREIDDTTKTIILYRLASFLSWVEEYSEKSKHVTLFNHHNLPEKLILYYLNEVLIQENGRGDHAISQHIMALNAYYNFLAVNGFTNQKNLYVKPRLKEICRSNTQRRTSIKYLTPELRSILYRNTSTIRDELLLKTGGEMGLRSKENLGFLLNDFKYGRNKHKGLKSLFLDMENNPEQKEFIYYLQGTFTKSKRGAGGMSREVFISRIILERFRHYYDKERPQSDAETFFLNDSINNRGKPISEDRATKVFARTRETVLAKQSQGLLAENGQMLEPTHTHHVLRHSFGTDKFYQFSEDNKVRFDDVVPTSQVYLAVAALLGHNAADGSAPQTTRRYIRSCQVKDRYSLD